MNKTYALICVLLIFSVSLSGQEKIIRGKVSSADDGTALPGVSVVVKGTTRGTVTDLDGNYSLPGLTDQDVLIFSFIGYETQEVTVSGEESINILLVPGAQKLEEVVVTALGIKRQKREIGYSTEKLEGEMVTKSSAPNVLSGMTGRAAGVQVSNNNGVEGGSTRIVIRGNNNINGENQPLIVVDGVPMENTPGLENIGRGRDWGNAINNLNAFDIESYDILKGGAASALYGSRGANGVILITTKRGEKRQGIGITYNMTHKIIMPFRYREVQDVYGHGGPISLSPPTFPTNAAGDTLLYPGIYGTDNLVLNQSGETTSTSDEFGYYGSGVSWGPKMEGQMVKWWDGVMRPWSPQPDNLKLPFHNGYTQTHNLAAAGGNEKGTMRVSVTRLDHKPIVENSEFDQTTVNFGGNLKLSEKVRADMSLTYVNYNRLNSPMTGEEGSSFSKGLLYSWGRSYKGIDKESFELPDGSQNPMEGYPFYYVSPYLWWDYYNNNTTLARDKYFGSVTLTYDITPWLSMFGRAGRDFTLSQYESRNKPTDVIGLKGGYYSNSLQRDIAGIYEYMVSAGRDNILNREISLKFTVGGSRWQQDFYSIGGHSGTWYYPNMYTFNNYTETTYYTDESGNVIVDRLGNPAGSMVAGEDIRTRRTNSVFSFLNLGYKSFLFLDITGRNDWSSTLPPKNNSYFYPSLSVSFIASEAFPLQEKISWLNFLKVRGGVAQTATDTEPYQTEFYYSTGYFGGEQTSFFPSTIPPFELKPQRVNSWEAGLIMGFLDNRIDLDFTYYYLYSFDQIIVAPVPASSGASHIKINEGVLTNKGIEIILNTVPVQNKNLLFRTGLNFARNRNTVVSLGDYADVFELADIWGLNGPAMILREGDDYGTISGYDYVYHENGQPILNDAGTHYLITDTRVPIGNASPDFLAGWHAELKYKGFSLSTLIDTKWGGEIYCGSYVIGLQTGQSPETLIERQGGGLPYTDPDGNVSNTGVILDGVFADGTPNNKVVHYYYKYLPNAGGWGKFLSTPGILENTWVKLRDVTLSYTIPQKVVSKAKVFQSLTLNITGRDICYIYTTLPDKINPEGLMGSGNAQGFEWASFPSTRSVTFGISAAF
ncbi:MAG: SusC/RagA family TonB-linked outer membrane protein [Bacteroidales bacterium]|nr:SusC/RagA family TonB-linked outer membrane protein [Bacteroidales bacterium]